MVVVVVGATVVVGGNVVVVGATVVTGACVVAVVVLMGATRTTEMGARGVALSSAAWSPREHDTSPTSAPATVDATIAPNAR
jgi:hypothetical protein